MEQKYRAIDIDKDVRMGGDEASHIDTDEWSPIGIKNIGDPYSLTFIPRLKYRRPITEQYVYEPAIFHDKKISQNENNHVIDSMSVMWRAAGGQEIRIGEMSERHLLNAHSKIGGRIGTESEKRSDKEMYGHLRCAINNLNLRGDV